MRARLAEQIIRRRLEAHPDVALVGPRQCGKTTLAKALGGRYYDLEQDPERLRLDLEWNEAVPSSPPARRSEAGRTDAACSRSPHPHHETQTQRVILDEAQSWPDVFRVEGSRLPNVRGPPIRTKPLRLASLAA